MSRSTPLLFASLLALFGASPTAFGAPLIIDGFELTSGAVARDFTSNSSPAVVNDTPADSLLGSRTISVNKTAGTDFTDFVDAVIQGGALIFGGTPDGGGALTITYATGTGSPLNLSSSFAANQPFHYTFANPFAATTDFALDIRTGSTGASLVTLSLPAGTQEVNVNPSAITFAGTGGFDPAAIKSISTTFTPGTGRTLLLTNFEIIPEPATSILAMLAAPVLLGAVRRRAVRR